MNPLEDWLFNRRLIDNDTGCWLWTGKTVRGYGYTYFDGQKWRVHRLAASLWLGLDAADPKQHACHTCRNTHCFNPEHLYIGTQQQNSLDRRKDGTAHSYWNATLTEDQVREIISKINSVPLHQLASEYNVDPSSISSIKTGRTWKHIERT